jgi:hypothetical protein
MDGLQNPDEERIRRDVETMRRNGAPEEVIRAYLQRELSKQQAAPQPAAAKPAMGMGDIAKGVARSALGQGLGFQFGDEIEAGFRTGFGKLGDYKATRDQIRSEQAEFADQYPGLSIPAEIGGAIIPSAAALIASGGAAAPGVAARMAPLGARVARAAAAGAASGAVTGAGAAPEMEDVPAAAGLGAGVGTVVGGAIPAVGAGMRALGSRAVDVLETPIRAMAENAPPPLPGSANPFQRAVRTATNAPALAAQKLTAGPLDRRAQRRAEGKLMQALADDELTPEMAAQRLEAMQARGAPGAVADVGEENLLELANTAYLIPGQGRRRVAEFFQGRVQGASGRLAEGVEKTSRSKLQNINQVVRQIDADRKPPAKLLYEEAYAHGPVQLNEDGINLLLTSDARKAWFEGLRRSRLEAFTDADKKPLPALFRVTKYNDGEETIELLRDPTVRDIDVVKRGFDALIGAAQRNEDADLARILTGAKNTLVTQVDVQAPAYKKARQFWGGQQGLMDALESGKRFLRGGADDFEDTLAGLNPDERDMYRLGAANAIAEQLRRREGRAVAVNILTDPTAQQRLRKLYPDEESFEMLRSMVEDELRMAGPYARMTRQSQTAQNLAGLLDFATDFRPGDLSMDAMGLARLALMGLANAGASRARTSTAAQLADLLTQQGPEAVAYLRGLSPAAAAAAQRAQIGARAGGRLGGVVGGQLIRGY